MTTKTYEVLTQMTVVNTYYVDATSIEDAMNRYGEGIFIRSDDGEEEAFTAYPVG